MPDFISEIWERSTTAQPPPSSTAVLLTGLVALASVLTPASWRWVRLGVTAVHEGGHAFVAVLAGRRLQGIHLNADTSGLMLSRGRPTGPGMIATLMAGYLAPAVVGLGAAWMLTGGYALGLLWLTVAVLAVMLLWIRNAYGFLALAVGLAVAAATSWYAAPVTQTTIAYLFAWTLLLAAPRPVFELLRSGRHRNRASDPDQLAQLTHVPALVWILLFLAANAAGLIVGATTLMPELSG